MKKQTQVALAVGAGYVLGRGHRLRLAVMLGTAALTGGFGGLVGQALRRGTQGLGTSGTLGKVSPELGQVTKMVRGELLDAGKAAALTVVRGRVERVSEKLHDQAELLRQPRGDGRRPEPRRGRGDERDADYQDQAEEPEELDDVQDDASDYEDSDELADEDQHLDQEDDELEPSEDSYDEDDELELSDDSYNEPDDGEEPSSDDEEPEEISSVRRVAGRSRASTRSPVQRTRR